MITSDQNLRLNQQYLLRIGEAYVVGSPLRIDGKKCNPAGIIPYKEAKFDIDTGDTFLFDEIDEIAEIT